MPVVACTICNKGFYVKPSHLKLGWGKCCSIECRTTLQRKGKLVHCLICNKEIYRSCGQAKHSKSGNFFCSKRCQTNWRNSLYIQEKHPNWLNGIGAYRRILMRNGKQPLCLLCKLTDERVLSVHHIDHNRKNNLISNLIWLCMNCHYLIHHYPQLESLLKDEYFNEKI